MTGVQGARLPTLDDEALRDAADGLVAGFREKLDRAGRIALLPDVHYPYHPSSGMVTNPAVVDALARSIGTRTSGTPVDAVVHADGGIDPSSVATMLGYDSLARSGRLTVTPVEAPGGRTLDGDDGPATDARPAPTTLAESAVLVVPSVRTDREVGFAGALATLTRAVGGDPTEAEDVRAAQRAVDPIGAVADATYVFTGTPFRASTLLGSSRLRDVDRAVARLLSLDAGDSPPLAATSGGTGGPAVAVRGVDVEELRARLPAVEPLRQGGPGRLVRAGYRLYAAVSGDVYPPHLRTDG